jgi:hypothetical protein
MKMPAEHSGVSAFAGGSSDDGLDVVYLHRGKET